MNESVATSLTRATTLLSDGGEGTARLDAEVLLAHALGQQKKGGYPAGTKVLGPAHPIRGCGAPDNPRQGSKHGGQ